MDTDIKSLFTTRYKKPIYSQLAAKARIALLSIKRRSKLTTNSTGCTPQLILKRIESIIEAVSDVYDSDRTRFLTDLIKKHDVEDVCFPLMAQTI